MQSDVEGLVYIPNFLTQEEHDRLLELIDGNEFSTVIHRRQQFYGETYYHTTHNLARIQPVDAKDGEIYHPIEQMKWLIDKLIENGVFTHDGDSYPTQCLVNEYVRNMGIASHFDDTEAFGDVIAAISLGDPIYMTMKLPKEHSNSCQDILDEKNIFIEPRSLFVMKGASRNAWRHGIRKAKRFHHPVTGEVIVRDMSYRRVSITIRKLLDGRKRTHVDGE